MNFIRSTPWIPSDIHLKILLEILLEFLLATLAEICLLAMISKIIPEIHRRHLGIATNTFSEIFFIVEFYWIHQRFLYDVFAEITTNDVSQIILEIFRRFFAPVSLEKTPLELPQQSIENIVNIICKTILNKFPWYSFIFDWELSEEYWNIIDTFGSIWLEQSHRNPVGNS